jgi:hypothetical protein
VLLDASRLTYLDSRHAKEVQSFSFAMVRLAFHSSGLNVYSSDISGSHGGEYEHVFWDVAPCTRHNIPEDSQPSSCIKLYVLCCENKCKSR